MPCQLPLVSVMHIMKGLIRRRYEAWNHFPQIFFPFFEPEQLPTNLEDVPGCPLTPLPTRRVFQDLG